MKKIFLDVLNGKLVSKTPIWFMRQAGRYLPEYRKVRNNFKEFLDMCKHPSACCEVTLQPLNRYNLDAAIIFSDILTIPDAIGMDLSFVPGKGPVLGKKISSEKDILTINISNTFENLKYVMDAISLTKNHIKNKVPLIGFSGSPWTLSAYMVEGRSSSQFLKLRKLVYENPKITHTLLKVLSKLIKQYLLDMVNSGVDALMIFDTWGGLLSNDNYPLFSLNYIKQIIHSIKKIYPNIPIIIFTKGGGNWINIMRNTGCDSICLDWQTNLISARKTVGSEFVLQGNLDPALLYSSHNYIHDTVKDILKTQSIHNGYIFNLGHGIYPDTDPTKVKTMVETVREFGKKV